MYQNGEFCRDTSCPSYHEILKCREKLHGAREKLQELSNLERSCLKCYYSKFIGWAKEKGYSILKFTREYAPRPKPKSHSS